MSVPPIRYMYEKVRDVFFSLHFVIQFPANHNLPNGFHTYLDLDDKLGSDIFRRLFRWFRLWDSRSLYDSERFTDTGADLDLVLQIITSKQLVTF